MAKTTKERKNTGAKANDNLDLLAADLIESESGDELANGGSIAQIDEEIEPAEVNAEVLGDGTMVLEQPQFSTDDLANDPRLLHLESKRRKVQLPQWATAWLVLLPALIFIVMFMFYPIINTFIMAFIEDFRWVVGGGSFTLGNFISAVLNPSSKAVTPSFGFGNFQTVLSDSLFLSTIGNTALLVVLEVPLTILISLLIATCLNSIKFLRGLFQTIFFLPYVTNTIALGLIFNILFKQGDGGLVNIVLGWFGIEPVNWLLYLYTNPVTGDPEPATKAASGFVIVVYAIWNGLAFKILVFMSGLATIDKQYYDAARVDGSSRFTIWRRITLPLLSPQILYITITSFIGAFKMYTGVRAVFLSSNTYYFGGSDGTQWMPVVGWIYRELKQNSSLTPGIAAAGSLVLLVIILLITAVQFAVSKKRVHY